MRTTSSFRRIPALTLVGAVLMAGCGDAEARDPAPLDEPLDPVVTETAYGFDDIDMDGDSELDADEIHEWAEGVPFTYSGWVVSDTTAQGFYASIHNRWDTDNDGTVSEAEWDVQHEMYPGLTEVDFVDWDMDGNSEIVSTEFVSGFEATGLYARVDGNSDGVISDMELRDWFFDLVDVNDDQVVDDAEWEMAEPYYDPDWMM